MTPPPLPPHPIVQTLRERLDALAPLALTIKDDSHLHRHHAEGGSGLHLRLSVVSARFDGLGLLARHRLVYQCAGDLAALGVHALAVAAKTPAESAASLATPAASR